MDFIQDIQSEIEMFFDDLNWSFIIMYVIILYGVKNKEDFAWYKDLIYNSALKNFQVWVTGFIVGGFFVMFRGLGENALNSEYISQLLRSWIMVIAFNTLFTKKIKNLEDSGNIYKKSDEQHEAP